MEKYGLGASSELAMLLPAKGTPEHPQCRFWMHYAEGSLMNWLLMKLVFRTLAERPMPFFAKPIVRTLCARVQANLVDPNLRTASDFIEEHLSRNTWFTGEALSMADFQMSFPVEALLSRGARARDYPHLSAYRDRMNARPAFQRALAKGGPIIAA